MNRSQPHPFTPLRTAVAALLVAGSPAAFAAEPHDHATPPAQGESDTDADTAPEPYVAEANLPEGFPAPGPAHTVSLKHYPTYRVAIAQGRNAFWRLFGHIQRADIPMTAPVTMANEHADASDDHLDAGDAPVLDRNDMTMGFLYPAAHVGDLGPDDDDDSVTVRDVPPMNVLSYGFFGDPHPTRLAQAREAIEAAHETEHADLTFAGPWRLLGYNGPSVPADRRYYEVQRPVTPKPAEVAGQSEPDPPAEAAEPGPDAS
ncbi:MAG: heme-binding protein [Planctomycetota bacterium]